MITVHRKGCIDPTLSHEMDSLAYNAMKGVASCDKLEGGACIL